MDSYREADVAEDYGSEGAVAEYLGVASELRDLIEVENELLRQGLPSASLSRTDRKQELTEAFAIVSVLDGFGSAVGGDSRAVGTMRLANTEISALSAENSNLLASARDASLKRIDAVIEAALGTCGLSANGIQAGSR